MGSVAPITSLPRVLQPQALRYQVILMIAIGVLFGVAAGLAYHTLYDKEGVKRAAIGVGLATFFSGCQPIVLPAGLAYNYFKAASFGMAAKRCSALTGVCIATFLVTIKVTQMSICVLLPKLFEMDVYPESCLKYASHYGDVSLAENIFSQAVKQKVMRPHVIKQAPNLKDQKLKREVARKCASYENTVKTCVNEALLIADETVQLPIFLKGLENPIMAQTILRHMKAVKDGEFKREILNTALLNAKNIPEVIASMQGQQDVDLEFIKKLISQAKNANISLEFSVPFVLKTKDDQLIKTVWLDALSHTKNPMVIVNNALSYGKNDLIKAVFLGALPYVKQPFTLIRCVLDYGDNDIVRAVYLEGSKHSGLLEDALHIVACEYKRTDLVLNLLKKKTPKLWFAAKVNAAAHMQAFVKSKYSLLYLAVKYQMQDLVEYLTLHHSELIDQKCSTDMDAWGYTTSPIDYAISRNNKDIAFVLYCSGAKVSEAMLRSKGWGDFITNKVDKSLYPHLMFLGIPLGTKLTSKIITTAFAQTIKKYHSDKGGTDDGKGIERAKKARDALKKSLRK